MATEQQALIDRVVAGVLQQLHPPVVVGRPASSAKAATEITDPVVTAEILEQRLNGQDRCLIGARSILTPAARDVLRQRGIVCERASAANGHESVARGWRLIATTVTPAVESLLADLQRNGNGWTTALTGLPREAIEQATIAVCREGASGVAVVSDRAQRIVCLLNRNRRLRAAVVADLSMLAAAREQIGANVIAVDPTGKSFVELRNLLRQYTAGGPGNPPADWESQGSSEDRIP